jgi:polyhydroxyalkanoate synthesis regulator phasin
MPAPRSSSSGRPGGSGARKPAARQGGAANRPPAAKKPTAAKSRSAASKAPRGSRTNLAEQLANRIIKPFDLVLISRERIQQTLDEAAERGRVTRADANELVAELVRLGRLQTDDLLKDLERLLGRGRDQLGSATRRVRGADSVERIVRSADRARRTVGVGPSFPIGGYDDLTAGQVEQRLAGLKPAELRKVRDYERRHANRKSVLEGIERALA